MSNSDLAPPEPLIHYADENFVGHSPCGDKGRSTIVTNDYEDVTCEKCLAYLRSKLN